jgi:hypothetical protein
MKGLEGYYVTNGVKIKCKVKGEYLGVRYRHGAEDLVITFLIVESEKECIHIEAVEFDIDIVTF